MIEPKLVEWFDQHWYKVQFNEKDWAAFLKAREDGKYSNVHVDETPGYVWLPSVTTKLQASPKPFVAKWRGEVGNDEANRRFWEAGDKGTRVHNATQMYDEGGAIVYQPWGNPNHTEDEIKKLKEQHDGKICILHDQDELWQVWKWRRFVEETGGIMVEIERIVHSLNMNAAGTIDRVMTLHAGEYKVAGSKPLKIEQSGNYVLDIKTSKSIDDDYYLQVAAYQKMYEEITKSKIHGRLIVHTNATAKRGIEGLSVHFRNNDQLESDYNAFLNIAATWERRFKGKKPTVFNMPSILSTKIEGKE